MTCQNLSGVASIVTKVEETCPPTLEVIEDKIDDLGIKMEKMMDKKAHIYFLMKDYESSRDILNQVIRINPKADVSLFHRGIVLIELADYEGAVRDLKEAFKLCPTDGYRTELNRAEKLLKNSIEQGGTDHYKTLGVDRSGADLKNIKNKKLQNAIIFFHFLKYPIIIFI